MPRWDLKTRASGAGLGLVSTWMRQGVVRSVQTGTINLAGATTNTAAINAVSLTNTMLFHAGTGASGSVTGALNVTGVRLTLTNATTVTATRQTSQANNLTVVFFVLEFLPGFLRSVQRFTDVDINGGTTKTQALTAVNTTKALIVHLGTSQSDGGTFSGGNDTTVSATLTSSTLVTLAIGTNPGVATPTNFDVIEFY